VNAIVIALIVLFALGFLGALVLYWRTKGDRCPIDGSPMCPNCPNRRHGPPEDND
jgi:hypothetical protein